jgi:hypothetical protein
MISRGVLVFGIRWRGESDGVIIANVDRSRWKRRMKRAGWLAACSGLRAELFVAPVRSDHSIETPLVRAPQG